MSRPSCEPGATKSADESTASMGCELGPVLGFGWRNGGAGWLKMVIGCFLVIGCDMMLFDVIGCYGPNLCDG